MKKSNPIILAINPGSTSTKLALFHGDERIAQESLSHTSQELAVYKKLTDQSPFRSALVFDFLRKNNINPTDLSAVVGRGGLLSPMPSGTYRIDETMLDYLRHNPLEHASNLGALLASEVAQAAGVPAYIVDPVVVDEMEDVARISGIPEIRRVSIFHALNQKAIAREAARDLGKPYGECNLIVAHLGGGISVGAHERGRVIDVNNALNGDGPFTPERAGAIPSWSLVELALSGRYTREELKQKLTGKGGLVAHLGTNDVREVIRRVRTGDHQAELVYKAMAYTVAKEIAAMAAALRGVTDAVVITGGIAYNDDFVALIKERISFIAPVMVYPGEDEMSALSKGALRVLIGEETAKTWQPLEV
jgi:butyrate kinase